MRTAKGVARYVEERSKCLKYEVRDDLISGVNNEIIII